MLQSAPMPGFSNPSRQSQSSFRAILQAMSRPGTIVAAPEPVKAPEPMSPAAAMVALTLCDFDTTIWLDPFLRKHKELIAFLTFHTGAPITGERKRADFAFFSSIRKLGDPTGFATGTDTYPDRSTTLVLPVDALTNTTGFSLSGPGIESTTRLGVAPLPPGFEEHAVASHAMYPRGVDFIFCTTEKLACLPRSTRLRGGS